MKTCTKCHVEKPETEFCKNKSRSDGLNYRCKQCCCEYAAEHREEMTIRSTAWAKAHPERIKELRKNARLRPITAKYYGAHKAEIAQKRKARRDAKKAEGQNA